MTEGERFMHESGDNAAETDRKWMNLVAQAEQWEKRIKKINADIEELKSRPDSSNTGKLDDLSRLKIQWTARAESLRKEAETIQKSGVLNEQEEGYTLAREAIAWMEEVNEGWALAGGSPEEHVLHTVEHDDNIVDEGRLRGLEESAFERIENAWRNGIPDHLRSQFVEALEQYVNLVDNKILKDKAAEIVRRMEVEKR